MEKENGYMQQQINWKKIWLLYWERIWLIITLTASCAAIAAGIYQVVRALNSEGQFYRVSSDYYLHFNLEDYPDGVHNYNAYTWDTILRDDPFVDAALEVLPDDYTKEEIKASVTGEMLGDYRILTVYSTHLVPERAEAIARAYTHSLETFPDKVNLFHKIEIWSMEDCVPVVEKNLTPNIAVIGAVIGFVLALILCSIHYILDDSIYVETDFTSRFNIPFLGMLTRSGSNLCKQELEANLNYLLKESGGYYLAFAAMGNSTDKYTTEEKQKLLLDEIKTLCNSIEGSLSLQGDDLNALRASNGAILMIPWGNKNGRVIEKILSFLEKQDCKISGVIVYDADDKFLKKYYSIKNK